MPTCPLMEAIRGERRCFPMVELMSNKRDENVGYLLGLIAVVAFAVTLPATRAAVRALDPVFVGLGRALGAAFFAGAYLFLTRQRLPSRQESKRLIVVAAGIVRPS
jgi:drug/metabolite transporter (DMT)-like permease